MGGPGKMLFRAIMTVFLAVFLVGFGVCGAAGVVGSIHGGPFVLACGAAGLGIAYAAGRAIWTLWRKPPPDGE